MKKRVITIKIESVKKRHHYVLFCTDTPFLPKVVKGKKPFKRKPKHKNKEQE